MAHDHDHGTATLQLPPKHLDYSLTGENASRAIERGLAEADWYQCPVPRAELRKLLERRDGPAIRDTLIWFLLLGGSGYATWALWGSWWAAIPYMIYAAIYAGTSDSRWHESSHGTAFKTDWLNNALYEIASFTVMRESTLWRWSHTRHHSDTIIVGRDPEIAVPRPPDLKGIVLNLFNLGVYKKYFGQILTHALGRMTDDEKTYIPESEFGKIYTKARVYVAIYAGVIALAISTRSVLPLMLVGLVNFFGSWLVSFYGYTQHAGLAENVLDHRLNCRTVYMNPIHRYLYWNMNYHVEHHMFPLVPYHNLPRLHALVKDDMPTPYPSLLTAYREIIPAVLRQVKDPGYHVKRVLPAPKARVLEGVRSGDAKPDTQGWIEVCAAADLGREDVIRFDHGRRMFALMRDDEGSLRATDGICTHGNTHLAEGLVKGKIVECPKHNGRFNLADGSPARAPICRGLATYPLEERHGRLWLNVVKAGGVGTRHDQTFRLKLTATRCVSTFIRELEFVAAPGSTVPKFTAGDYLQFDIPAYGRIKFADLDVPSPYREIWQRHNLFDLVAERTGDDARRNNYSLASNPSVDGVLRFNVRIATPPPGLVCSPGIGSAHMWSLKVGDEVTGIGPFGDFHIKPSQREMIYIGGGAGMAPLRAHLSHLLETEKSARKINFFYGARSRQELFYDDYFARLASEHTNFVFTPALSAPLPEDNWTGATGFIHEVALEQALQHHANPKAVEYYLCGPPMMIKAVNKMLTELGVPANQISYDEF
jgi:Na+-transporting NADH:ubiquinone oxidoreductase subunit F